MGTTHADEPTDRSGQVLAGRYRVERLLDVGATASVWLVRHVEHGSAAVAKIHEAGFTDEDDDFLSRERFVREAEALSSVRHQNVVELFEVGQTLGGEPFLIMERLVGEALDERLWRDRPSLPDVVALGRGLLAGLEAVHASGVLHRDLKPENIFLACTETGAVVKLLDFGLARGLSWRPAKITRAGAAVGTPGYMSPEQARGRRDLDVRTDLYSVGVVLYEMLTGRRPFEGSSAADIMVRCCTELPVCVSCHRADLPASLAAVVMRALGRDPAQRWDDAASMRHALELAGLDVGAETLAPAAQASRL